MTRNKALGIIFIMVAAFVAMVLPSGATPTTNPNTAEYWEAQLEEDGITAYCYKYETIPGYNSHGTSDGASVVLNPFDQSWPGDHWALLVVKGGSVDTGNGPGNNVIFNPTAGVAYFPPTNGGGNVAGVSHWIVCKGETPEGTTTTTEAETTTTEAETTTSTTEAEPTTTTEAETTTTTEVEETTTTTEPEETTTTTEPEETTTTTEAETTTTTEQVTTTTEPEEETTTTVVDDTTTSTVVEEETTTTPSSRRITPSGNPLPRTGGNTGALFAVAAVLLVVGLVLVVSSKPKR